MSAICPTCNSKLSCGCQLTTASDGARICTLCRTRYEQDLLIKKQQIKPNNTAPTNMVATYTT